MRMCSLLKFEMRFRVRCFLVAASCCGVQRRRFFASMGQKVGKAAFIPDARPFLNGKLPIDAKLCLAVLPRSSLAGSRRLCANAAVILIFQATARYWKHCGLILTRRQKVLA